MAVDIKRALIDPEYRKTLTPEELARLPLNPAGDRELTENDLDNISGGRAPVIKRCASIGSKSASPKPARGGDVVLQLV